MRSRLTGLDSAGNSSQVDTEDDDFGNDGDVLEPTMRVNDDAKENWSGAAVLSDDFDGSGVEELGDDVLADVDNDENNDQYAVGDSGVAAAAARPPRENRRRYGSTAQRFIFHEIGYRPPRQVCFCECSV